MGQVELIHIGTELLTFKVNTHTPFIAKRLAPLGLKVSQARVVGDDKEAIGEAIKMALERSSLVLVSGGLGPTFDDLTREAASSVLNRKLIRQPEIEQKIFRRFKKLGLEMTQNNRKQALIIDGAKVLDNDVGTAPGQYIEMPNKKTLVLLPGPIKELESTLDKALPLIGKEFGQKPIAVKTFKIVNLPESHVEEKIQPLLNVLSKKYVEPIILYSPYVTELIFNIGGNFVEYTTDKIRRELIKTFGPDYLGEDGVTLESVVGGEFKIKKKTLAVAESCTGGLIIHRLTNVPGSSSYFLGGIVAYSGKSKAQYLGVRKTTMKKYGEVSSEVAREMALGALDSLKSDYAISVTGICGPTGATRTKPVGLAYFGLADGPRKAKVVKNMFLGEREVLKEKMSSFALDILRRQLLSIYRGAE